jgi:hypothetical protein
MFSTSDLIKWKIKRRIQARAIFGDLTSNGARAVAG